MRSTTNLFLFLGSLERPLFGQTNLEFLQLCLFLLLGQGFDLAWVSETGRVTSAADSEKFWWEVLEAWNWAAAASLSSFPQSLHLWSVGRCVEKIYLFAGKVNGERR